MSTNSPFAFRHFFRTLKDPRVQGRTTHRLLDIVFMALCAVIADCNDWQEIALFVREHRAWFEQFLDLQHGVPSHDTFERVFQALDPQAFQGCFLAWIRALETVWKVVRPPFSGGVGDSGSAAAVVPVLAVGS